MNMYVYIHTPFPKAPHRPGKPGCGCRVQGLGFRESGERARLWFRISTRGCGV